jgi:protein SCO1/2
VRHATLGSSSGTRFDLAGLTGEVVVISDMTMLCQETCPLDTANVVAAARSGEHAGLGDRITFLSITIDPRRDTPLRLAAYRRLYGAAPADWMLATGTPGPSPRSGKRSASSSRRCATPSLRPRIGSPASR